MSQRSSGPDRDRDDLHPPGASPEGDVLEERARSTLARPTGVGTTTTGAMTSSAAATDQEAERDASGHVDGRARTSRSEGPERRPEGHRASRSTERRNAARTVSGELVRAHRRGTGGFEAERGADREGRPPRPGRIVWRHETRERGCGSRPASSRISPERAPERAGPRRPSGGSGGGPAAGATSRKLHDAVVVADPQRGSPTTHLERPMGGSCPHAAPVADAQLVLAQERRTGWRETLGHGPRDTRVVGRPRDGRAAGVGPRRRGSARPASPPRRRRRLGRLDRRPRRRRQ